MWNLFGSSCAFTVSPFLAPYSCVQPHAQLKLLCFAFGPKICSRKCMVFLRLLSLNGCLYGKHSKMFLRNISKMGGRGLSIPKLYVKFLWPLFLPQNSHFYVYFFPFGSLACIIFLPKADVHSSVKELFAIFCASISFLSHSSLKL